jgi:hypothetical protein
MTQMPRDFSSFHRDHSHGVYELLEDLWSADPKKAPCLLHFTEIETSSLKQSDPELRQHNLASDLTRLSTLPLFDLIPCVLQDFRIIRLYRGHRHFQARILAHTHGN